jgi:RNA recognition motif-containing protein
LATWNFEIQARDWPACSNPSLAGLPFEATSNMSDASRLKATVYVGGLDNAVTAETLHAAFVPFGDIADISLPKPELPSSTDPHRGFGYVEFEQAGDAKEAIDNMDQSELYGRVIKVAPAKPQKDQNEGLGSKTAIWEQVCHVS